MNESLLAGGIGFALVSLGVFSTVAFGEQWLYRHAGTGGSYALWALLFMIGGGAVLNRLVIGPRKFVRFGCLFAAAFFLYACGWTAAYFTLRGLKGEWVGSFAGSAMLALTLAGAFSARDSACRVVLILFVAHSAAYFLGRLVWTSVAGPAGMVLWGALYGLGFGSGLGYALYVCQDKVRARLNAGP